MEILEEEACMTPFRRHISGRICQMTYIDGWRDVYAVNKIAKRISSKANCSASPPGTLETAEMDLLGRLPKRSTGKRLLFVLTDRYCKLSRAIPTRTTTAPNFATILMDKCVMPYGFRDRLFTENGPQFFRKLFESICPCSGTKRLTTSAYQP